MAAGNELQGMNYRLSTCRIAIEYAFGLLKQRFRQLYHLKIKGHERICKCIKAFCVLHKIADEHDVAAFAGEETPTEARPENLPNEAPEEIVHPSGRDRRNELATQLYDQRH
jgi:hypothetical protein